MTRQEPRDTETGVVSAREAIDRNDGGNSTGLAKTTTPLGRGLIPEDKSPSDQLGPRISERMKDETTRR